ncbi:27 kDa glycoprotein-like isoform X2 [Oratosquilla oratoria]
MGQQMDMTFDSASVTDIKKGLDGIKVNLKEPEMQIREWKDRCRNTAGAKAMAEIEDSIRQFPPCVQKLVKVDKLEHELNHSIPRGNLDLVFKKYCNKRGHLENCIDDVADKLDVCLNEREKEDLNITREALEAGLDFICHEGGDRIALFMAEEGQKCVESQMEPIKKCIEENIPELKDSTKDLDSINLNDFTINEQNCKKVNIMRDCIVQQTSKCKNSTPQNILDSLIMQMLKATPCWQSNSATNISALSLLPIILTLLAAVLTAFNIIL